MIQFRKVTWYSKLLALVLFIALAFFGFYFGMEYKNAVTIINNFDGVPTTTPITHIVPQKNKTGILEGQVSIGPICPVERIDQPCKPTPEMYAARKVVIYAKDQKTVVKKVSMDDTGFYKVELPIGHYWMRVEPGGIGPGVLEQVEVEQGTMQIMNFDVDTGIR